MLGDVVDLDHGSGFGGRGSGGQLALQALHQARQREAQNEVDGTGKEQQLHQPAVAVTDLPLGDPAVNPSVSTAIFLDSRSAVDTAITDGLAAGGKEPHEATDYGFMYQRQLNDPDGNILEFGYMDPVAAQQGPEAYAGQQA